ncbi:hypothetical protein PMIN03_009653, partial [Paraphaeosphaeria minitans]
MRDWRIDGEIIADDLRWLGRRRRAAAVMGQALIEHADAGPQRPYAKATMEVWPGLVMLGKREVCEEGVGDRRFGVDDGQAKFDRLKRLIDPDRGGVEHFGSVLIVEWFMGRRVRHPARERSDDGVMRQVVNGKFRYGGPGVGVVHRTARWSDPRALFGFTLEESERYYRSAAPASTLTTLRTLERIADLEPIEKHTVLQDGKMNTGRVEELAVLKHWTPDFGRVNVGAPVREVGRLQREVVVHRNEKVLCRAAGSSGSIVASPLLPWRRSSCGTKP